MAAVTGGIIDTDYAKTGLQWTSANADRDADLASYIEAATPIIEDVVGPVLPKTLTRRFHGGKSGVLIPHRLVDENAVTAVNEDESAITDYFVDDIARVVYAGTRGDPRRFSPGTKNIQVTYTTGFASNAIPATLKLAARELVRTWYQQSMQGTRPSFDDAAASDSVLTPMGFAIPRRVYELCSPFVLPGI